jgi:hypothetical protein
MAKIRDPLITVDQLRDLISYDAVTGKLTWRARPLHYFSDDGRGAIWSSRKWNARYAGTPALASVEANGYGHGDILGLRYKAHRVAWALHYGAWPNQDIDHIDGDPQNNRIGNLRLVSDTENMRNQKLNAKNTSGHMGVYWHGSRSKWCAFIKINRRKKHLGLFPTKDGAISARKAAERQYGFHPNHGRKAA